MGAMIPSLRLIAVPTRYGQVVCDFRESVCHALIRCGEFPHWRDELTMYDRLPLDGATILDVGANIGVLSRLFARRAAHVHSFEPSIRARRLLEANATDNMTIYPIALSDRIGTAIFAEIEAVDMSSFSDAGVEVETSTIDHLNLRPDFIKIDVEGFEHLVLRGAMKTIAELRPLIVFEALSDEAFELNKETILSACPDYRFVRSGINCLAQPADISRDPGH